MSKITLKYFVIACIGVISFLAQATPPTAAVPSSLASQFLLTDIALAGDNLIAVGERGHILQSKTGETWQQANVPVNVLLTSVSFKNDLVGFATGHDATILKTIDGGLNWSIVHYAPELDKPFLSIVANKTNIVAVGAYGMYMMSSDGGDQWNMQFQDELLIEDDRLYLEDLKQFEPQTYEIEKNFLLPHFNNISLILGEYFLAGEAGFLASSVDGINWQRIETDYYGSYFNVLGDGSGIYLSGLRGNIFESIDGGNVWKSLNNPTSATINSAIKYNDYTFFFANSGNLFYRIKAGEIKQYVFDDGKALMSGLVINDKLILVTEAGIKSLQTSELTN